MVFETISPGCGVRSSLMLFLSNAKEKAGLSKYIENGTFKKNFIYFCIQNSVCILLNIQLYLHLVRPNPQIKVEKDLFMTFAVTMNTDK